MNQILQLTPCVGVSFVYIFFLVTLLLLVFLFTLGQDSLKGLKGYTKSFNNIEAFSRHVILS